MDARPINVRISRDRCQAHLVIRPPVEGPPITRQDICAALEAAGVRFGLMGDALDAAVAGDGEPVLVAEASKPLPGTDGWVEFLVEKPVEVRAAGAVEQEQEGEKKIDLRELHLLRNVLKGDMLARVHVPVPGTCGTDVTGQPIPPREGKQAVLHLGAHVAYAADDHLAIVATEDGNAVVSHQDSLEVRTTITVPGNVDFSTGNIDFVGSLVVNGDIKSDFTVKVRKSLQVLGNVEDALVEAGEDVVVRKGFVGRGKGSIVAGRNVSIHHVLNQSVVAKEDLAIEQETVNGNLQAGKRIAAPRAVVAGGSLEADQEIIVGTLGNSDGVQARVRLGRKGRILERIGHLEKEMKQAEKQLVEVKDAVYRLIRARLDVGVLCEEKEASLKKLQDAQKMLPGRLTELGEEKGRLEEELKHNTEARLVVHESVFENVLVEINGVRKLMDQSVKGVTFVERNGKVEMQPCEEKGKAAGKPAAAKSAGRSA